MILCFVDPPWAYFTSCPLDKQWGNDWEDAPYEHNAGSPYEWRDYMLDRGVEEYQLLRMAYRGPIETPADLDISVSVEHINSGRLPWLTFERWSGKPPEGAQVALFAGATIQEFRAFVRGLGGEVYETR